MNRSASEFSLFDPEVQSRPHEFYSAIHREAPVYLIPELGAYMVCGFDELRDVLRDPEVFSSQIGDNYFQVQGKDGANLYKSMLRDGGWDHVQTLQRTDPPIHGRYRRLVDKVFTPRSIRALAPHIEAVANDLIDGFISKGECEFVAEFALPLPGIIIAEELGLDRKDLLTFKRWADALLESATVPMDEATLRRTASTEVEMQRFLADIFEKRRIEPREDLISRLVHAEGADGERLSMSELQNVMHQLISGGFDTTTSAIAHGLWLLLRHPEQMALLQENPHLQSNFIDEALRLESPVQGLMRHTTRDVTIGGINIPAGSNVITRYGAANQDPAIFACPHAFDIQRQNANAHLAFGYGPHFCVGRLLARQELEIAIKTVLGRLGDIVLKGPMPSPPHHPSMLLHPLKELSITFTGR